MRTKPCPARPDLEELIKKSIEAVNKLSPKDLHAMRVEQAISFVYGNLANENDSITREMVEKVVHEHYGVGL